MMKKRFKILCVADYYLPGFKGGGIRTIANMSLILKNNVTFNIVTRNHDLGEEDPYPSIKSNSWNDMNDKSVYYADPKNFTSSTIFRLFLEGDCDILYLNSFFSIFGSISICWHRVFSRSAKVKVLLAPRGEFSPGALALKSPKKKLYLWIAQALRIYDDIHFHASTEIERDQIKDALPNTKHIHVAADPIVMNEISEKSNIVKK